MWTCAEWFLKEAMIVQFCFLGKENSCASGSSFLPINMRPCTVLSSCLSPRILSKCIPSVWRAKKIHNRQSTGCWRHPNCQGRGTALNPSIKISGLAQHITGSASCQHPGNNTQCGPGRCHLRAPLQKKVYPAGIICFLSLRLFSIWSDLYLPKKVKTEEQMYLLVGQESLIFNLSKIKWLLFHGASGYVQGDDWKTTLVCPMVHYAFHWCWQKNFTLVVNNLF